MPTKERYSARSDPIRFDSNRMSGGWLAANYLSRRLYCQFLLIAANTRSRLRRDGAKRSLFLLFFPLAFFHLLKN